MDIEDSLTQANARLKQAKLRFSIYRRGNTFWLQGTFPPKPHIIHKTKPYQLGQGFGSEAEPDTHHNLKFFSA